MSAIVAVICAIVLGVGAGAASAASWGEIQASASWGE
jgi:hypothetical protein